MNKMNYIFLTRQNLHSEMEFWAGGDFSNLALLANKNLP